MQKSSSMDTAIKTSAAELDVAIRYFSSNEAEAARNRDNAIQQAKQVEALAIADAEATYEAVVQRAEQEKQATISAARAATEATIAEADQKALEVLALTESMKQQATQNASNVRQQALNDASTSHAALQSQALSAYGAICQETEKEFSKRIESERQRLNRALSGLTLESLSPFLANSPNYELHNLWVLLSGTDDWHFPPSELQDMPAISNAFPSIEQPQFSQHLPAPGNAFINESETSHKTQNHLFPYDMEQASRLSYDQGSMQPISQRSASYNDLWGYGQSQLYSGADMAEPENINSLANPKPHRSNTRSHNRSQSQDLSLFTSSFDNSAPNLAWATQLDDVVNHQDNNSNEVNNHNIDTFSLEDENLDLGRSTANTFDGWGGSNIGLTSAFPSNPTFDGGSTAQAQPPKQFKSHANTLGYEPEWAKQNQFSGMDAFGNESKDQYDPNQGFGDSVPGNWQSDIQSKPLELLQSAQSTAALQPQMPGLTGLEDALETSMDISSTASRLAEDNTVSHENGSPVEQIPITHNNHQQATNSHGASSSTANGENEPVKVFIPRPMVGRIIGKGGMVINQIRAESGADVRIVDHESDQGGRTLTIQGTPAAVAKCEKILNAKLRGDDAQVTIFIPEDMVGRIIGKGGVNIKRLTTLSGADAHLGDPQDATPRDDEECPICLEAPMSDPEFTRCDHAFCRSCIREHLKKSEHCPICDEVTKSTDLKRVRHRGRNRGGRMLTIRGSPDQVVKCEELVHAKLRGDERRSGFTDEDSITETFMIPEDKVGRIIGRGGSMIKQLRSFPGADVRMGDRETEEGRILTVRGPSTSVTKCKELVLAKLET